MTINPVSAHPTITMNSNIFFAMLGIAIAMCVLPDSGRCCLYIILNKMLDSDVLKV